MEQGKSDPPMDRERGISFPKLLELVRAGNRDEDVLVTLAARLDRMDRQLTDAQRETVEAASGGVSASHAGRRHHRPPRPRPRGRARPPDLRPARRRDAHRGADARRPGGAARGGRRPHRLRPEAVRGAAGGAQGAGGHHRRGDRRRGDARRPPPDLAIDHDADKALVGAFEAFCQEHKDELDALTVLYSRPYAQRLTRKQLMELVAAIQRPPRQWTSEALWAAYERVEKGRVRGASKRPLLTDVISLARHALGVDDELVSYADQAHVRFETGWRSRRTRGARSPTSSGRGST
jgi:type I restriction enzyme R subunit